MPPSIKRALVAVSFLGMIVAGGTIGFSVIENWGLFDSLWMTVITMSTVGYGEVHTLDQAGRMLAILIIFATLLISGYALGNLSAFIIEGEIASVFRGRKLEKTIAKISGHTILVSYGRVGREAAALWATDSLVIIDRDPASIKKAAEEGFFTVEGDATDEAVLHKAGIERAKALMVATGDVADNILICMSGREMNPGLIISARGNEPSTESKLHRAGADKVVLPNQIGGRRMTAFVKQPAVMDFLDLVTHGDDLSLKLEELHVPASSPLVGKTLGESKIRQTSGGVLVMSVKKANGQHEVAPGSDFKVGEGDLLIVIGTDEVLRKAGECVRG